MSEYEPTAWPNVALLRGRLYGLGAPERLPEGLWAFDACGQQWAVGGREARALGPCEVTSENDRHWLECQTPKGCRPALVGNKLAMLPASAPAALGDAGMP